MLAVRNPSHHDRHRPARPAGVAIIGRDGPLRFSAEQRRELTNTREFGRVPKWVIEDWA
ncbi:MAG: hypothetical protein MUF04_05375 [Akkermansiaceae bacterium]|jgi:hypothetical protein|nr:hypothetical protein [Akkermansiaceae bacterium]